MINQNELLSFYISRIQDDFVPYWNTFADDEKGGILNCIDNYGGTLLSENKFTWSQGRYLWILGKLYNLCKTGIFPKINKNLIEKRMEGTWRFLTEYSIYGDSVCCYLLDRSGGKILDERTRRYDASIFADCFALIGMANYVKTTESVLLVPIVEKLYKSIVNRLASGSFLTEPYPVPQGYVNHSIPMIMVNTVYEYVKMREQFNLPCTVEIEYGLRQAKLILEERCSGDIIREFISTDANFGRRLLDRHINPGHTLEDIWFLYEFLHEYGDLSASLPALCALAKKAFTLGWDEQYGGLLRFVDKDGGSPRGESGDDPYETLIKQTWDMKLWWPHSEALYTLALLHKASGDEEYARLYAKAHEYVFRVFPNRELGEWIQIRRRDGTPEEKVVALPVKDPFHILRNFIKLVELWTA